MARCRGVPSDGRPEMDESWRVRRAMLAPGSRTGPSWYPQRGGRLAGRCGTFPLWLIHRRARGEQRSALRREGRDGRR